MDLGGQWDHQVFQTLNSAEPLLQWVPLSVAPVGLGFVSLPHPSMLSLSGFAWDPGTLNNELPQLVCCCRLNLFQGRNPVIVRGFLIWASNALQSFFFYRDFHLDCLHEENNSKDLIPQGKTMECVKNACWWAVTFEISEPRKWERKGKYHASFIPMSIYTLDSKPRSRKVENRYDKTWLGKWPECAPIVLYTK